MPYCRKIALSIITMISFLRLSSIASPLESALSQNESEIQDISLKIKQKSNSSKTGEMTNNFSFTPNVNIQLEGARIVAKFAPQNSQGEKIELTELAAMMGYDHFNWVNYVEKDPHGISDREGKLLVTPYNDPPLGGYQYDFADQLPFYWDLEQCVGCSQRHNYQHPLVTKQYELIFEDIPADPRLQPTEAVEFVTHLVGVKSYDTQTNQAEWDILNTFKWQLTNPLPYRAQVSLIADNIDLSQIAPSTVAQMHADGAALTKTDTSYQKSLDSLTNY